MNSYLKMKIFWKHVDEFVSSSEQIWRNLAWHQLLTNGSSAVRGQRLMDFFTRGSIIMDYEPVFLPEATV